MQETSWEGEKKVTPEAMPEDIDRAVDDPNNKEVKLFRPGAMARLPGGQLCVRGDDGEWYCVMRRCIKEPPFPVDPDKLGQK